MQINIDYAADDSCQINLWAKGFHEPSVFLAECEKRLLQWDGREISLAGKPVSHECWRTVPADSETKAQGVCDHIRIKSKPGKSAYAVTVLDEWLPLHSYQEGE